jgi:serine-type D-Ala-D-Ala carboxypeptidase (penicillin-binding protein 5/6)
VALLVLAIVLAAPRSAAAAPRPERAPQLDAAAWVLVDGRTGETLSGHKAAASRSIASTTKLMTAYLALHGLPLRKTVRAAPYTAIPGESLLGLRAGQRVSVRDLLYGLILRSGNDAAVSLADAVAGSEGRFVGQMNRRAAALGLADTHYANPIGLDAQGNHSSARDLVALSRRLLAIPAFARIADSRRATLRSFHPPRKIVTRNTLLLRAPWATGVKTGHTLGAGYVLVASGERKGVELISAVLGAPSEPERDADSLELLDYGFSQYRRRRPIERGQELASPSIRYSGGELPLVAGGPVVVGVRRDQRLQVVARAPREVEGPIAAGRRIGSAVVYVDGRRAATVPLRASRSIAAAGSLDKARSYISDHPLLLVLAGCGILVIGILFRRFRNRGKEGGVVSRPSREQRRSEREQARRERVGGPRR